MLKKRILTCALALATLAMASSCAPSDNGSTSSSVDAGLAKFDEQVAALGDLKQLSCEVTFWHSMGKTNQAVLDTMITEFNKIYPNIKITHSAQGGYDDVKSNIADAIPAGTTPTMAYCYPDHVADYLPSDSVVKLDNFMNSSLIGLGVEDNGLGDKDASDYIATYLSEGNNYTLNGKKLEGYYSMPFSKSTEVLFYNKDVFSENGWTVPTTWDQMWTLCKEIKATYGDEIVAPLGYDSDSNLFISFCEQRDIPYTSATGDQHYLFDNDKAKEMVTDLKTKYDEGLFITKGSSGNNTYTSSKFTAGEILMSIGSTGGTTYNQTMNFTVGVAEPPAYDLSKKAVISQGPSICFFNGISQNATPKQLRAAWKFYKFISSAENSTNYAITTGYQPVRTSSYETATYKSFASDTTSLMNKVASVSSGMLDSYFNSPVFVGSAKARNEVGSLISAVLLNSKTVDQAFEDAFSNCVNAN